MFWVKPKSGGLAEFWPSISRLVGVSWGNLGYLVDLVFVVAVANVEFLQFI